MRDNSIPAIFPFFALIQRVSFLVIQAAEKREKNGGIKKKSSQEKHRLLIFTSFSTIFTRPRASLAASY